MISLTALLNPTTQPQLRASLVSKLKSYGVPADQWVSGGTYSTILTAISYVFAGLASLVTSALSSIFLSTATGAWLVALAYYVYGVVAQQATFGVGTVTLTNIGGGVYNFAAGSVVMQATNGNTFVSTAALSLGAGTPSVPTVVTLAVQAQAQGSIGGAGAGQITTLTTSMPGVSVTNAIAVLGLDADSDATVRSKCLAAIAARSYFGPTGAYYAAIYGYGNVAGALNSVTQLPVAINRIQVYRDPNTGAITVFVASPNGAADPNDVIGCQTAVNAIAQPMGVTASVSSCAVVPFTAQITLWSTSAGSAAAATIAAAAATAVGNALALYPIGGHVEPPASTGYLFGAYVQAAAMSVDPTCFSCSLSPSGDLALGAGQVAAVVGGGNPNVVVRQAVQ